MRTQARSTLCAPTAITCARCQASGHGPSHSRRARLTPRFLAIAVGIAAIVTTTARAEVIAPAGLAPGDTFQLVFVTDPQTAATNTDMAYYDNIVNTLANAAGLGTYNGAPVTWLDLGSTSAVSALSREPTTDTAPIYNMGGFLVARSATALWKDHLQNCLCFDEYDRPIADIQVWTGTGVNGTGVSTNELDGTSGTTAYGYTEPLTQLWVDAGDAPSSDTYAFYAISPVLTVPTAATATPEPATAAVLGVGLAGLWAARRRRRTNLKP